MAVQKQPAESNTKGIDDLSVSQIFGRLTIGQFWSFVVIISGIIGLAFAVGYKVNSITSHAEMTKVQTEVNVLNSELNRMSQEIEHNQAQNKFEKSHFEAVLAMRDEEIQDLNKRLGSQNEQFKRDLENQIKFSRDQQIQNYRKKDRFLSLFLRLEQLKITNLIEGSDFDSKKYGEARRALDDFVNSKLFDESERSVKSVGKGQKTTTITFWDGSKWTIPPDLTQSISQSS